jgi:PII interaction protein X
VSAERYLNHPTFGMLYRVAPVAESRDLYATLYAQRIFFLVTLQARGAIFEVIPLMDARHYAEQNLAQEHVVRVRKTTAAGVSCSTRRSFDGPGFRPG